MEGELTPCERGRHTWRACITNDGGKHKWLECRRCNKVKGKTPPVVVEIPDANYVLDAEWQRIHRELTARPDQLIFMREHLLGQEKEVRTEEKIENSNN